MDDTIATEREKHVNVDTRQDPIDRKKLHK